MNKLDAKTKKIITQDWAQLFPGMSIYKPMWLMKRHGPLLIGICLERNSANDNYLPSVYVHNLARSRGFITLTLNNQLIDKRSYYVEHIKVKNHATLYEDAAYRLEKQSLFPIKDENLKLSSIISSYKKYMTMKTVTSSFPAFLYIDIVSLLAWCGKIEDAKQHSTKYLAEMKTWEKRVLEPFGGFDGFSNRMMEVIENPEIQVEVCEREAVLLEVDKLADYGLICD